ncbi:hypothetical protein Agub_g12039, partial [Astrephomene gubernaculifera]
QDKRQEEGSVTAVAVPVEAAEPGAGAAGSRLRGVAGMTVCVTGVLQGPDGAGMQRSELQALLEAAGAVFHSSVKTSTQLLVVGDKAGGRKPQDAAKRGVRVLSEEEFWGLYGN